MNASFHSLQEQQRGLNAVNLTDTEQDLNTVFARRDVFSIKDLLLRSHSINLELMQAFIGHITSDRDPEDMARSVATLKTLMAKLGEDTEQAIRSLNSLSGGDEEDAPGESDTEFVGENELVAPGNRIEDPSSEGDSQLLSTTRAVNKKRPRPVIDSDSDS